MPKVSVAMSVYNEPVEWLRIAIDSIVGQTFKDWEFIIVNDNPLNETNSQLLKEYAEKDPRFVILQNEQNIGLTKSLNKALKVAKGEYIARMDADDMSLPPRFERQVEFLDSHPGILAVGSWTGTIDKEGNRLDSVGRYESDPKWARAQFIQNSQISHPAAMFHRIINGKLIQYDESVRYAQDYSLMVSILEQGDITNIPEVLFCYRTSDTQITSSKRAEQQACAFKAQKRAFELFGFKAKPEFQDLFFNLTIRHDSDQPTVESAKTFREFFNDNKATAANSLALELIYGSYLSFLRKKHSNSWQKALAYSLKHDKVSMHKIGIKFFAHLAARKIKRKRK